MTKEIFLLKILMLFGQAAQCKRASGYDLGLIKQLPKSEGSTKK